MAGDIMPNKLIKLPLFLLIIGITGLFVHSLFDMMKPEFQPVPGAVGVLAGINVAIDLAVLGMAGFGGLILAIMVITREETNAE